MRKYLNILLLLLLLATGASSVYYFSELEETKAALNKLNDNSNRNSAAQFIESELYADSLLERGKFKEALIYYQKKVEELPDSLKGIYERKAAVLNSLLGLAKTNKALREDTIADSTIVQPKEEVSRLAFQSMQDSLAFALKKANLKIKSLQQQVKKQTFGDYLVFESSKGSKMYYVGEIKEGKANGKGTALLETGSRYEGDWKDNMRHGDGTFYWKDGEYYIGEYKEDQRAGLGSYYWPNGEYFTGQWSNNKRNGEGTFYDKEGNVITKGVWKNDELVKQDKN